MPYLPGLIPKEVKVLPDYFNNRPKKNLPDKKPNPLLWLIAVFFFLTAFFMLNRPLVALSLVSVGLLFTPVGKRWIEKAAQFRLTSKIRLIFCSLLLLLNIPFSVYYQHLEEKNARLEALRVKRALQFTADSLKQETERKDSLTYYFSKSQQLEPKAGLAELLMANKFVVSQEEKTTLNQVKQILSLKLVDILIASSKNQQALDTLQQVLKERPRTPILLYKRAICYLKLGNIQLAVNDLDTAKTIGFKPADQLYNKVNPIRRRVAYYETLCNDGTSSSATGRGACSWHGGVREWNHPVYEEYRKY